MGSLRIRWMGRTEIFKGKRVLIVEDEIFIAVDIAQAIEREGGIVYGPVTDQDSAKKIASFGDVDFAIVDFKLGHTNSLDLAEFCFGNDIPCVCYTGYRRAACHANMEAFAPVVQKPVKATHLLDKLAAQIQLRNAS
jgi:DNA-binding NtrC family response regulator